MSELERTKALLGLTAEIVSAHVKNNQVAATALPALIEHVFAALRDAGRAAAPKPAPVRAEPERQIPVVSARKSLFPDYIVCLEDGRKLKTLKRHLRSTYNLTPEQYREKWGLAADYPMVAPSYAERRSALAKQAGLGRKPGSGKAATAELDLRPRAPAAVAPQESPSDAGAVARPAQASPVPMARNEPQAAASRPASPASAARQEAPSPIAALAMEHPRDSRPEHTAASVFAKFPRAQAQEAEQPPPPPADGRKSARKPFSKQLARGMRPT